ncbi:zinc-ribbon and DUF3426 domain-containing protein [Marinicella gelatinilytica]|uniref:zinc-ribbon and DUF3426 domain-containing protein n=1 Tax=Marinicella gelatinilytica TaxID=2996017 RepID=UPI002260E911|nr:zinc-ribbon and DUF3426 domain-containing protein [Marinicella gelatinilytica]MCX7544532.1 zinc-ribbon and DUF3426 domain-containing protein [Marinicella gelatinilytica]
MLYTQCRGCGEVFIIDAEHLTLARGQVRCHVCGTVFDALATLTSEQPLDDEDLLLHDSGHAPPLLTRSFHVDETAAEDADETFLVDDVVATEFQHLDDDELTDDDTPDFLGVEEKPLKADLPYQDAEDTHETGRKWWGLMSVVMVAGILWQAQQALADGRLRLPDSQWADRVCDALSCAQQNRPLDLTNISLVSRNIRSHPGRDNALIISASMIKTHSEDQRFPALSISLSDLNGQVIAMRRFKASEYLTADILQAGFINNTLVPITLEIQNPGENAVAFEIGFSQP